MIADHNTLSRSYSQRVSWILSRCYLSVELLSVTRNDAGICRFEPGLCHATHQHYSSNYRRPAP